MKGVELPINILVIVAIAVIVLLGMVALYFLGMGPFQKTAGLESYKNQACSELVRNCSVSPQSIPVSFDADKDDQVDPGATSVTDLSTITKDNLMSLCYNYFAAKTENACRHLCACPGY